MKAKRILVAIDERAAIAIRRHDAPLCDGKNTGGYMDLALVGPCSISVVIEEQFSGRVPALELVREFSARTRTRKKGKEMKKLKKFAAPILALVLLALLFVPVASAQVVSNVQQVSLSLLVGESLTLGPPSVSTINYTYNSLTNSASPNPSSFTVPLSWSLSSGHGGIRVVSWVANNGVAGLSAPGGLNIPASDFFLSGTDTAGNFNQALTACGNNNTVAGVTGFISNAGCGSFLISFAGGINNPISGSETLTFGTNIQNLPALLAPGGYTATLFFQAVTF